MQALLLNLRLSLRSLRKSPGFTLTALLTIALGIGAITSVFSVVNTVLLKPFAFHDQVDWRSCVKSWGYAVRHRLRPTITGITYA